MVFQHLEWIQTNSGYSYNHRVESVKGGDTMHSDVGHFYNMKRKSRGRTATNYFVGGSIGGMLGSGGFGNGSGFRDYMNGGGIFGAGRSQSYMGPAHNPGNSSVSGYGADIPGGSGGGGGGDTFGAGGCSHFNGGRC